MHKFFGILKQSVQLSWTNIKSNKMRTFLTTLGIIIGVTAVISMITIVNGVIDHVMSEFSSLGAGSITVNAIGTPLKPGLTDKDIENIRSLDNVAGLTPSISFNASVVHDNRLAKKVSFHGVSADYYLNKPDAVTLGRAIQVTDVKDSSYVCIIDNKTANNVFPGENPIGKKVIINGISFTVIGMEGKSDDLLASFASMGNSSDGSATIPYTTANKLIGSNRVQSLEVYISDTNGTQKLIKEIENLLYKAFNQRDDGYYVYSMDSLLDTMNSMMKTMNYMLAGIASIALLVGGIGIMNMMLVSVTERTKEIGLRKAMGATPGRIQLQFLLESVFLSLLGGVIGVILGLTISVVAAVLLETKFIFSAAAVALGVGFSTAVGVVFGWAPAKKASQLSPIDALRSE